MSTVPNTVVKAASADAEVFEFDDSLPMGKLSMKNNLSAGDTTAKTNEDSFTEVTQKRSRREDKLASKEKMQKQKITNKLSGPAPISSATESDFKAPAPKSGHTLSDNASERDDTDADVTYTFDQTAGGTENLTKKKRQYAEEDIQDRTGAYTYADNPDQYKKARKRLQNRESAVRSRMKKRQEMEILEEQVRQLQEQKVAVEIANEELKRQNKYWEDLFAKQQLSQVVPVSVNVEQPPQQQPVQQVVPPSLSSGLNSMSDFTRSDQANSDLGHNDSSLDPSFTSLRMQSDRGNKCHKRSDSGDLIGMFEFDKSLEADEDNEHTFDRDILAPPRSVEIPSMGRQLSNEDGLVRQTSINFDHCFLERQPQRERGNYMFFGLAVVFGAVGTVSSFGGIEQVDANVGCNSSSFNSGMSMKSSDRMTTQESMPLKHADDFEETVSLDPSSTSQNLFTAFRFLLQALKTVPIMTYISFALSILFLVLYLNPFASLLQAPSQAKMVSSKSHRSRATRQTPQSGASPTETKQAQSSSARKSRASSGKRRSK